MWGSSLFLPQCHRSSLSYMHIVAGQFTEERLDRDAHFWTESAATGNFTMREHAPGNGERYAGVESARADTPTTIGQHHDLVSNLYLLASCLARGDNVQQVAILPFDIFSRSHIEQAGQRFAR